MPWTLGPSRQPTMWLCATVLAVGGLLAGGCENGQVHNPHGMQSSIGGHGHRVGQRENQGPAVGSDPAIRDDLEFFGSDGGVKRQ